MLKRVVPSPRLHWEEGPDTGLEKASFPVPFAVLVAQGVWASPEEAGVLPARTPPMAAAGFAGEPFFLGGLTPAGNA